jgi:hypothetical protein
MYGTAYEDCLQNGTQCTPPCGYNPNTFALYTSTDLVTWTFVSDDILPQAKLENKVVNYWMPVVKRNPHTGVYVKQYWSSCCGFRSACADIATATWAPSPWPTPSCCTARRRPRCTCAVGMWVEV